MVLRGTCETASAIQRYNVEWIHLGILKPGRHRNRMDTIERKSTSPTDRCLVTTKLGTGCRVGMVNSPQHKKAKKAKFIAASIMLSSVLPKQDDPSSLFKARRISEVICNFLVVMTR